MKTSSLVGHTAELYDLIMHEGRPADSIIDRFFRSHKYLGSNDRRFIAEHVYGMIRYRSRNENALREALREAPVAVIAPAEKHRTLLLCAAAMAAWHGEHPGRLITEYGEESETGALLAYVLPRLREALAAPFTGDTSAPHLRLAWEYSFTEWMTEKLVRRFGVEDAERLCKSLNDNAPITLRVNTVKTTVDACIAELQKEGIAVERTKFSPFGLTLAKRTNVFSLEAFRNGFFEMQDEGSQLLGLLVDPKPTSKVVDACAGGGGKTLALAALMKNRGSIYALDINNYRLEGLRKRIKRSGVDTVRLRAVPGDQAPEDLIGSADNVLVDAPCTGIGTIRRNPGMKWSVTPQMIAELSAKQSAILARYAQCVKVNGRLVYATCTMFEEENEQVVEGFLKNHPEFQLMKPSEILIRYGLDSLGNDSYFQLLPHVHGTDGFFAAVMKRIR
ncbi:MAG: class I SAM-dependent methyltransferase [Ignavibacteriales bacterium]|nr:class I SAM-dependent methyltransferase [Ignavibacteriales bacterium]